MGVCALIEWRAIFYERNNYYPLPVSYFRLAAPTYHSLLATPHIKAIRDDGPVRFPKRENIAPVAPPYTQSDADRQCNR